MIDLSGNRLRLFANSHWEEEGVSLAHPSMSSSAAKLHDWSSLMHIKKDGNCGSAEYLFALLSPDLWRRCNRHEPDRIRNQIDSGLYVHRMYYSVAHSYSVIMHNILTSIHEFYSSLLVVKSINNLPTKRHKKIRLQNAEQIFEGSFPNKHFYKLTFGKCSPSNVGEWRS